MGTGGVWIDPNNDGVNRVWQVQLPADIVAELFIFDKPKGAITNSDIELEALVLQESISLWITKAPAWHTPTSGSDNTPTVSWSFKDAAKINTVVPDLLIIWSSHNRDHRLSPSVLYHPGTLNTIADDTSHRFDLYPH